MKQAFTLIELLVVILIVGILSAIALPQYQKAVDLARIKSMFPVMRAIKNAEVSYRLANGEYTDDFSKLDIDFPIKKYNNDKKSDVTLVDGNRYTLNIGNTSFGFLSAQSVPISIFFSFEGNTWLCYPCGTTRGKNTCKALGCVDVDQLYCSFKP